MNKLMENIIKSEKEMIDYGRSLSLKHSKILLYGDL
jgi:hypothetical protein